jgi:hypothetical protein
MQSINGYANVWLEIPKISQMPHIFAGKPEKVARKNEYLETLNLSRKRGGFCYFEAQDDCRPEKKGRSEERDRSACSIIVEQRLQPACGKDGSQNVIFHDPYSTFLFFSYCGKGKFALRNHERSLLIKQHFPIKSTC